MSFLRLYFIDIKSLVHLSRVEYSSLECLCSFYLFQSRGRFKKSISTISCVFICGCFIYIRFILWNLECKTLLKRKSLLVSDHGD